MQRYFLEIAYKGTHYNGWQLQPNQPTVQAAIEKAISTILREETGVLGCGRTDAGVHAKQYFLQFDTPKKVDGGKLVYRLNGLLNYDVAVKRIIPVSSDAHARFDATERTYQYFIHSQKNPFLQDRSLYVSEKIDLDAMNKASEMLLKNEDFESFSKVHTDVNNFNCKVSHAKWSQQQDQWMFEITANRFLRNMVRAVVGTLLEVGSGKISLSEFDEVIKSRSRSRAGKSVAARGLFLTNVKYPYIS